MSTPVLEPPRRSLFSMTWPIFLELVLQMLVGNADQFMIGRYSQTGAAAIGNCNQVMNVFLLTFGVVNTATTILISQYKGANNRERMGETASLALFTNLTVSLVIGLVLIFGNRLIFAWMRLPSDVMVEACAYFRVVGSCVFLPAEPTSITIAPPAFRHAPIEALWGRCFFHARISVSRSSCAKKHSMAGREAAPALTSLRMAVASSPVSRPACSCCKMTDWSALCGQAASMRR